MEVKLLKKLVWFIVLSSSLGIMLNVIQTLFFDNSPNPVLDTVALFKYFTIQSNALVIVYFGLYAKGTYNKNPFFQRLFGTVFISIFVTGFVFASYLEWTFVSNGLHKWASAFNHYVSPILVTMFAFLNRKSFNFMLKDILVWMIYPIVYLVFLLLHGVVTGDYLYIFFQVDEVGLDGLIIAIIILVFFFFGMSFLFVKIFSKEKLDIQ